MPKANKSLKELLHEVRRVAKSREVLTEKRIRKIYQSLVTDLNGFLGNAYTKYADSDGRLSATLLQQKGQYAKFLEEIVRNVDGISPEVKREITSLVEETYKSCYTGMVESVKTAAADSPFAKTVEGLSVQPTVLNTALNNNISKLTLPTVLEKHRQEVVYDIQQTLNVGLLNGDRYETMAKRITDRIDVSYGKATNIVRTETHRNIEQGLMDGAEQVAPVFNEDPESNLIYAATWCTMLDERVRPSQVSKGKHGLKVRINRKSKANHQKMEGQIIQVGGKFKLEAHVFAKCPGMSGTARNDCNCRCFLEYELLTKEEFKERNGKLLKTPSTINERTAKAMDSKPKVVQANANTPEPKVYDYLETDTQDRVAGDSLSKWTGADGKLLPEREELHRQIIDDYFKDAVKPEGQPIFTVMGGGPASGKSTMINSGAATLPKGSITVDSDAIKSKLPEYKAMIAAGDDSAARFVHEESSALAKRILGIANNEGYNVVLDGTGDGSVSSLMKKIQNAKKSGMRVEGIYATVPTDEAISRATKRAIKSGRKVPTEIIRHTHKKVSQILPECADKFDDVKLFDTTGDAVLIATGGNGSGLEAVIGQESNFAKFLEKANE